MLVWQYTLLVLLIAIAFPVGKLIARTTKEELKAGKKVFFLLMVFSLLTAILILFTKINLENKLFTIASMLFIFIIVSISYCEGKKKG